MRDKTYEEWKAEEELYKSERRVRHTVSEPARRKVVEAAWDAVTCGVTFENLIPLWQNALVRFVGKSPEYETAEQAWRAANPQIRWGNMNETWRAAMAALHKRSGR